MKKFLQILINSRFIFLTNILEKFVFFLFFLVLARQLDKSSYGLVTMVFAFSNIINAFFDMGFPFYVQREAQKEEINREISAGITLKVISALLFASILLVYLYLYLGIPLNIISVIGALVYLNGFNTILVSYLYGRSQYKRGYYSFLLSRGLFLVITVYFLLTNTGTYLVLLTLFISVVIHLFLLIYLTAKEGLEINFNFNRLLIKNIVKASLPFGVGSIFVFMYDKVDILLLERLVSLEAVAVYAVAYSFYKLPHILSIIVLTPVYTDFSQSYKANLGIKKTEVTNITLVLLLISLSSIILIYIFGESILRIFYGAKYMVSMQYLKVLMLALPALYFNNFTGVISNSVRKEKLPMFVNGIGLLMNIILNITGILLFGIWGAVFATIITEYSVFIMQIVMLRNYNLNSNFIHQY